MTEAELRAAARAAAGRWGVPQDLFERQIQQESAWDPDVVNADSGAIGLGQLMPGTARDLGVNPHDPMQNLEGAAHYMRQMLDKFGGNPRLALAAYNAGPGRVQSVGGVPNIPETQNYVGRIMNGGDLNINALPDEVLKALAQQLNSAFAPVDQMGNDMANERQRLELASGSARNELMSAQAAPAGDTNPTADLFTRTLGNIADVVSGGQSGGQSAEKYIATEKQGILQKRAERLKLLADNAERLADRAAKFGLTELELKYRTQAERATANVQTMLEAYRQTSADTREAAGNASAERIADLNRQERSGAAVMEDDRMRWQERQANLRSMVTAGLGSFNADGDFIPGGPGADAGGRPTVAQWNTVVANVMGASESRGGNVKDEELRSRLLNLAPPRTWPREQYQKWVEGLTDANGKPLFNPDNKNHKKRAQAALDKWFAQ